MGFKRNRTINLSVFEENLRSKGEERNKGGILNKPSIQRRFFIKICFGLLLL